MCRVCVQIYLNAYRIISPQRWALDSSVGRRDGMEWLVLFSGKREGGGGGLCLIVLPEGIGTFATITVYDHGNYV